MLPLYNATIREDALEREHELDALITQARNAVRKLDTNKEASALTAGLHEIQVHDSESNSESGSYNK